MPREIHWTDSGRSAFKVRKVPRRRSTDGALPICTKCDRT